MSVQFFTEYPLWFIVFCLLAGAVYSATLYFWGPRLIFDSYPKLKLWVVAALRFLSVSIISFLLLNPLLKYVKGSIQKPIIVLAIDNSESILQTIDSAQYRSKITEFRTRFQKQVGEGINVQAYRFADKPEMLPPDFKGKQTNFSSLFSEINTVYSGSNVGAMVLVSDGIYTKGINPVYESKDLRFPVFTVGVGDTQTKKDLKIVNIRSNSIAYLNNTFPAVIDLQANKCNGQSYTLTLYNGEIKVYEVQFNPASDNDFKSVTIDLEAVKPGVIHYTAVLSKLKDEVTWVNNRRDFFIEVMDSRQKILVAARSPHPDISAITQAIESNKNYQVEIDYGANFKPEKLKEFDLAILHKLPALNQNIPYIEGLKTMKIPLLFILGRQTNLALFNTLKTGLSFSQTGGGFNQTVGIMNPDFNLFENPEAVKSSVSSFPPFTVPFGNFDYKDKNQIMVFQQIGSVKTDQPMIYFTDQETNRFGFFTGEGFWRWRLIDYDRHQNHEVSNSIICKSIQYLVARNDRRKFKVQAIENTFFENEPVVFNAEYYNQSYELVNKPEVKLILTNELGKNYAYTFSRTENAYKLDAGILAPGKYSYRAWVSSGGKNEQSRGLVVIKPLQIEFTETKANHNLLKLLAKSTGGVFSPFSEMDSLAQRIKKLGQVKSVMYEQKEYVDLINQKWVFFLILFCVSLEWLIRKRNGAY